GVITRLLLISPVAAGALPGLRVRSRLRAGSPDKCASIASGKFSHSALCSRGRRSTRLARATGSQSPADR
ncbi:hypothetical protein QUH46_19465, partial [Klebsiella grimontii]|uniref:hypothetical protein n=1 Tax=Klebsiella grimontii TaxID=2058152 RepID=UPI0025A131DA